MRNVICVKLTEGQQRRNDIKVRSFVLKVFMNPEKHKLVFLIVYFIGLGESSPCLI